MISDREIGRRVELAVLEWNEEVERAKEFIRFTEWCAKNPMRAMRHAHATASEAARVGILPVPRSCSRCGATFRPCDLRGARSKLLFHHNAPWPERYLPKNFLVGVWVCRRCHRAIHDAEDAERERRADLTMPDGGSIRSVRDGERRRRP